MAELRIQLPEAVVERLDILASSRDLDRRSVLITLINDAHRGDPMLDVDDLPASRPARQRASQPDPEPQPLPDGVPPNTVATGYRDTVTKDDIARAYAAIGREAPEWLVNLGPFYKGGPGVIMLRDDGPTYSHMYMPPAYKGPPLAYSFEAIGRLIEKGLVISYDPDNPEHKALPRVWDKAQEVANRASYMADIRTPGGS